MTTPTNGNWSSLYPSIASLTSLLYLPSKVIMSWIKIILPTFSFFLIQFSFDGRCYLILAYNSLFAKYFITRGSAAIGTILSLQVCARAGSLREHRLVTGRPVTPLRKGLREYHPRYRVAQRSCPVSRGLPHPSGPRGYHQYSRRSP